MNQFIRKANIILGTSNLSSERYDFEFDVEFDDTSKKDLAEVVFYNLSHDRINSIKKGTPIIINAGYENDVGTVFLGAVYDMDTIKRGVNRETTVKAVDATDQRDKLKVNKTYKEGTRASQIIADLCQIVGLSIGKLELPKDVQYRNGKNEQGVILQRLKLLAKDSGAKFNISKGMAYFRPPGSGDDVQFIFSPERGLIGSPEPFIDEDEDENELKGFNVSALLNHRIQPNSIVNIEAKDVKVKGRVRSGTHSYSDREMITEMEVVV
ncbi:hypothetical protein G4V62_13770 [Bacillaceae bacterium SIJ1]|uniref:phage protein n=1 Tax=Litoribacterium kuwaitense TaxID=1398745 RepID=UPI0013ED2687|nr:hypothetical protein [Litoribacterium kuwaitense]NGP45962.1 hypothetical protein [Litoribacterium kuwaitense]